MKKIKFLICLFFISTFSNSQTIYLTKDFNDLSLTSGGWSTQVVVDTTNWYAADFNGDQFAKISNYDNGNVPAEAWLISPSVDISNASQPNLSFGTIMKWPGAALKLYISTDYDGTSDPTVQGTWTDITSNANWDTNNSSWGNWTNSGDVDLSNYISNSVYIAYQYTGTSSDGSTWEVDDILIKEGGSGNNNNVSIYDIQYTTAANGDSPYANQQVSTGGIVNFVRNDGSFYLTSGAGEWTGIYVYDTTSNAIIGDSITLDAKVVEYYNLTELKNISNYQIISSGNSFPTNITNTNNANTESFEGCLIKVLDAECTNANGSFGEWTIDDGSGPIQVDDFLFSYTPTQNFYYTVTGLIDYNYGEFKLLPRNAGDVEQSTAVSEIISQKWISFPNPVTDNILNIKSSNKGKVEIIDIFGKVVKTQIIEVGLNTLITNDLSKGNYIIRLNDTNNTISIR